LDTKNWTSARASTSGSSERRAARQKQKPVGIAPDGQNYKQANAFAQQIFCRADQFLTLLSQAICRRVNRHREHGFSV
jgi:hypothetical protein